ncbi:hypothetical protein MRB53_012959 [Persea americana]|uniref:Uncharacterized protein n=1 Tax=Persea americana TaxID=3435 RepID=A0ACC2LZ33_PERAE|nr:hypothetical protein MRB53_012959 [Persea americana]
MIRTLGYLKELHKCSDTLAKEELECIVEDDDLRSGGDDPPRKRRRRHEIGSMKLEEWDRGDKDPRHKHQNRAPGVDGQRQAIHLCPTRSARMKIQLDLIAFQVF